MIDLKILKEYLRKLSLLWQNPATIPFLAKEAVTDCYNDLRSWSWPEHIIHIAGLPKSGSTWLFSLLCRVPGYNPCPGVLRPLVLDQKERQRHELSQRMFNAIPESKYTVLKLHTNPYRSNWELLVANKVKTIILIRDLRDVAVSRYVHEKTDRSSWCYEKYNSASLEMGMWHNLGVIVDYYAPWVGGWLHYHGYSPYHLPSVLAPGEKTYLLRYEDLKDDPARELRWLLNILGINADEKMILEEEERKTRRKVNLEENLNKRVGTRDRSTFNGTRRYWKTYFTREQEEWFRRRVEKLLGRCGYAW